ncbi:MAG: alpha/beta fold hydrolase [Bacilli bacterium]
MFFRKAILIIHGFAGGTYDQEYLANFLELEKNFDVFTFTLPGHDSINRAKVTKEEWIKCSEEHIQMLIDQGYMGIYVIGHSMGGVIACHLATKYKQIKKLVLAAPAFQYLALKDGNFDILEIMKNSPEVFKTYNKEEIISRVFKFSFKVVNEFVELVKKYQKTPFSITIPTLIIQGLNDSIVPIESSKYVFNSLKSQKKKILFFEKTTHDIFKGEKKEEISNKIKEFLKY